MLHFAQEHHRLSQPLVCHHLSHLQGVFIPPLTFSPQGVELGIRMLPKNTWHSLKEYVEPFPFLQPADIDQNWRFAGISRRIISFHLHHQMNNLCQTIPIAVVLEDSLGRVRQY